MPPRGMHLGSNDVEGPQTLKRAVQQGSDCASRSIKFQFLYSLICNPWAHGSPVGSFNLFFFSSELDRT